MRSFKPSSLLLSMLFAMVFAAQADATTSLTLAWDPPTDETTAGYIILYGTSSGVYTRQVDVGDVTSSRVGGLALATTYFFTVRAYDSTGALSEHSNEVSAKTSGSSGGTLPESLEPGGFPGSTPDGVIGNIRENRYIDIAWMPAAGAPDGYRVEVGTRFRETAFSALTRDHAIAFDMTDLPADKYFIRIRPVFGARYGHASEELAMLPSSPIPPADTMSFAASAQCVAPPRAPRQFSGTADAPAVALHWQPNAGEAPSGYVLEVGSAPGRQDVLVAQFAGNARGVTATATNAAYALRLVAVNNCGWSQWAPDTILYVGVDPLPGAPPTLTQEVTGSLVVLTWEAPTTGGPVTRYLIEAATPAGPFVYDTGTDHSGFAHSNTPPGQYVVTVRAGNATGFGPASAPVTVIIQ